MTGSRIPRLLGVLGRQPQGDLPGRMCGAATDALDGVGVGLSLVTAAVLTSIAASPGARRGEDLQEGLGEGPGFDVSRTGRPVAGHDLALVSPWPLLGPALVEVGVHAVFAFPLRTGGIDLGAMTVYRAAAGRLTDDQHADGSALATLSVDLLLVLRANLPVDDLPRLVADPTVGDWVVHQATGMVAVQVGLPVADALARLRAHAFATERPLGTVAADVVARRLRFAADP